MQGRDEGGRHGGGSGAALCVAAGKELIRVVFEQKPKRSQRESHDHSPEHHSS